MYDVHEFQQTGFCGVWVVYYGGYGGFDASDVINRWDRSRKRARRVFFNIFFLAVACVLFSLGWMIDVTGVAKVGDGGGAGWWIGVSVFRVVALRFRVL